MGNETFTMMRIRGEPASRSSTPVSYLAHGVTPDYRSWRAMLSLFGRFNEFARDCFTCGKKPFKESHKPDEPLNVTSGNSNTPPSSEFVSHHRIILFPTAWWSSSFLDHDQLPHAPDSHSPPSHCQSTHLSCSRRTYAVGVHTWLSARPW